MKSLRAYFGTVKKGCIDPLGAESQSRPGACARLRGVATAIAFARSGQLISAIKYLESSNPELSREEAKAIVGSFGYSHEIKWPEQDKQTVRCL